MTFRFIILAAGKGTRMKQEIPKALTPIAGKPILQYLYNSIIESGVGGAPVVVKAEDQPDLCQGWAGDCRYVIQKEQLGTGHAVNVCREAIPDADAVIVLYGDHPFISSETLKRISELHQKTQEPVSIMTTQVSSFEEWANYYHWGRIIRNQENEIVAIREYKDASEEERQVTELNPALYCFSTKWLWENIGSVKNANASGEYYLTDLIELAVKQGHKIGSMNIPPEEAIGINTQEEREVAEKFLANKNI